jgi:hypothetical protein
MIDDELINALHTTFACHLERKQEMSGHVVIATLLAYVVSELSHGLIARPEHMEANKANMVGAFKVLLDSVKTETTH